jgi:hypothetical protein
MELDARFQSIEDSLAEARRALADLADRSLVEQVLRQEYEYEKASQSHSRRSSAVPEENDTIRICHDCVSRNDIGTAFLTILRYIDSFANSKADSSELPERATREYVETRFGQLESVVRRQLTTSYKMLQRTVEGQLQKLMSDFSAF